MPSPATAEISPLSLSKAFGYAVGAIASFTLAYSFHALSLLIVVYLYCLISLARVNTGRQAFYFGLGVGMLAYSFQLTCFWQIFGPAAIALWFVVAFWLGLFVALARLCLLNIKRPWGALLIPFLWTGLEYFRSELYYLRFSWLNVGYVFSEWPVVLAQFWGMHFAGFFFVLCLALFLAFRKRDAIIFFLGLLVLLAAWMISPRSALRIPVSEVQVAGIQFEFEPVEEVLPGLDKLVAMHPNAELLMLCEYTLNAPPPEAMQSWCRENKKFLVVGGKDDAPNNNFYDTAFVISTNGEIVFKQVKAVPIQFFKDGLPAPEQKLWESPWGKIGLCVCYDLSYTRVTDRLIKLGAQAILCPTMDVIDWGKREHELHARVAPVRAAECRVPVFRVASSGISQIVAQNGYVVSTAPFPGQGEMLSGKLSMPKEGRLPVDRLLAPFSVFITGLVILFLTGQSLRRKFSKKSPA